MNPIFAICWLAFGLAAPDPKGPPAIVGKWTAVSVTLNNAPLKSLRDLTMSFAADGKLETWPSAEGIVQAKKYTLDPSKKPAEIDLIVPTPPGIAWLGLYKLEDDKLTICLSVIQGRRPTSFEPAPELYILQIVLKRAKKD